MNAPGLVERVMEMLKKQDGGRSMMNLLPQNIGIYFA